MHLKPLENAHFEAGHIPCNIDRVIWRPDLATMIGVSSQSIKLWIRAGKLPAPDVALSQKTMGWRLSTLRAAGVNLV